MYSHTSTCHQGLWHLETLCSDNIVCSCTFRGALSQIQPTQNRAVVSPEVEERAQFMAEKFVYHILRILKSVVMVTAELGKCVQLVLSFSVFCYFPKTDLESPLLQLICENVVYALKSVTDIAGWRRRLGILPFLAKCNVLMVQS